jgi:GH15 family glucan-1,4-alpha-glucosidase
LDAANRSPGDGGLVSSSLVYRYDAEKSADGPAGEEGTFDTRAFRPIEALTRTGKVEEARQIFEQVPSYANHPGLYAEEICPSGEAPGNFPQAFTHPVLISAAFDLNRVFGAGT